MKTIIIGSGLAGLTAALTLRRAGHEVEIIEQAAVAGGVTRGYNQDGFSWDFGQLNIEAMGENEPVGSVLKKLGILEKLEVFPEHREYIFPDFEIRVPESYGGVQWRIETLKQLFPDEVKGLDRYWADYVRFTRLMTLARRMETGGFLDKMAFYLSLLPLLPRKDWTAERLMEHYFRSKKLQAVFISILADFFTPPSQFMGLGVFALNSEKAYDHRMPAHLARNAEMIGLYTIRGGIKTLVEAFVDAIRAAGGEFTFNTMVKKILVTDNKVNGIIDQHGRTHLCDCVVASGGAKEALINLLDPGVLSASFTQRVKDLPLMDSVFMLHLGLDYGYPEVLRCTSTYFYGTYDVEGQVKLARQGIYHEGAAGFVVHLPSLRSPEMAPGGKHAMTIYTICPDKLVNGDWEQDRETYAEKLLEHAEKYLPELRSHVLTRVIVTPADLRRITTSGTSRIWRHRANFECLEGAPRNARRGIVVHRRPEPERRRHERGHPGCVAGGKSGYGRLRAALKSMWNNLTFS